MVVLAPDDDEGEGDTSDGEGVAASVEELPSWTAAAGMGTSPMLGVVLTVMSLLPDVAMEDLEEDVLGGEGGFVDNGGSGVVSRVIVVIVVEMPVTP